MKSHEKTFKQENSVLEKVKKPIDLVVGMKISTLPETGISKVIGLLEILHDHGDQDETVRLVGELKMGVEELLPVTEAAEMLGFIKISGGRIRITALGLKAIAGDIPQRRKAVKHALLKLQTFKKAIEWLKSRKNKKATKRGMRKMLQEQLLKQEATSTAERVIDWGRHAGLIGYDSEKEEVYLVD